MMLPTISLRIERWKFNKEYGVYVSTLGNFKDRYKRNLPFKLNKGYCYVETETGGWKSAHRLVLFTWKPIPNAEDLTVDHKNHNKRDNSIGNLEWVTQEENILRAKRDLITSSIKDEDIGKNNFKISFQKGNKRGVVLNSLEDAIYFVYQEQGLLNQRCDNIPRKDRVKNKILDAIKNQTEYCGGKWKLV